MTRNMGRKVHDCRIPRRLLLDSGELSEDDGKEDRAEQKERQDEYDAVGDQHLTETKDLAPTCSHPVSMPPLSACERYGPTAL